MSALPDSRRDAEFGSRHSLPAEGGASRADDRKTARASALRNASPPQDRFSKHATSAATKAKPVKANVAESYSSTSSDSDDE